MSTKKNDLKTYTLFQYLMSMFSSTNYTKSEFYLILKIIDTFGEEGDLSIEALSEASGVSMASISRFVKKIGFQNYTDFRIRLASMLELVHTIRKSKFANFDAYDIDPIIQNITATKASMDEEKISLIIHRIRSHKKCFMIGSVDDLATFAPFRKELCSCRIRL